VQVVAVIFCEMAYRHAPGFVNRGAAPGEGNVLKVSSAFERQVIGDEDFTSPDGAVGTVTGAVEGNADDLAIEMIFGHAGGDVRVVMLYGDVLEVYTLECPLGGKIIGVEIVGDDGGLDFENALEMGNGFVKEIVAFEVFQIADVLAEKSFPTADDADGVFEFAANRQDGLRFAFDGDGNRNETTRAAELLGEAGGDADDGIVAATEYFTIVDEESVGDAVKALDGFLIVDGDGFLAEVAAGHDQGVEFAAGEQEVMERGVGKKDAEEAVARGNAGGKDGFATSGKQDDGSLDGEQLFFGKIVEGAEAFGNFQARDHDGEWFFDAMLAFAELCDGSGVFCIAG